MLIHKIAFKGASWLAFFKLTSQLISWVVTIIIARILLPEDYALIAMATIITSYAEIFSELGLGASIIQRQSHTTKDLSSVFWFSMTISVFSALCCFPVSYITAEIFNEENVIPLTQTVSVLFILSGLQIVPLSLLKKDLDFRTVGMIEMKSTIISSVAMVIIAYLGGGVFALAGGRIVRGFVRTYVVYKAVGWRPELHFSFYEARNYIRFGVAVAFSSSLYYVFEASDRFFGGRSWSLEDLGYYLFALQLAKMPTEKIVVLINQVSYPVFSKLKTSVDDFNKFYLNAIKMTSILVFPIFIGGFFVGDEVISLILGEKWTPMIFIFEFLCLAQIMTSLNAVNNHVHMARGYPLLGMYYNAFLATLMGITYYYTVPYGKDAMIYPWCTTYIVITSAWIYFTLRIQKIKLMNYIGKLLHPALATALAAISLIVIEYAFVNEQISVGLLLFKIAFSAFIYLLYFLMFDRGIFHHIKTLRS